MFAAWISSPGEFAEWGFGEFRFTWPIDLGVLREDFERLTASGLLRVFTGVNAAETPIAMSSLRIEGGGRLGRLLHALIAPNRRRSLGDEFLLRTQQLMRGQEDLDVIYTMVPVQMASAIATLESFGYQRTGQIIHRAFEGASVDYAEMSCRREDITLPQPAVDTRTGAMQTWPPTDAAAAGLPSWPPAGGADEQRRPVWPGQQPPPPPPGAGAGPYGSGGPPIG